MYLHPSIPIPSNDLENLTQKQKVNSPLIGLCWLFWSGRQEYFLKFFHTVVIWWSYLEVSISGSLPRADLHQGVPVGGGSGGGEQHQQHVVQLHDKLVTEELQPRPPLFSDRLSYETRVCYEYCNACCAAVLLSFLAITKPLNTMLGKL